jgi:hypothetical protein
VVFGSNSSSLEGGAIVIALGQPGGHGKLWCDLRSHAIRLRGIAAVRIMNRVCQ